MIKADIVRKIAEQLKMRDKEALVIVDSTIDAMKKIVADSGRLEIRDFGVFQTKTRKQRIGRNPKDKKEYPIPARRVVTFKMGRELKVSGEKLPGDSPEYSGEDLKFDEKALGSAGSPTPSPEPTQQEQQPTQS